MADGEAPLPYQDLFGTTVQAARAELLRRTDPAYYSPLKEKAFAGWEEYLLKRLTVASAKAAHWQFQIFKTVRQAFPNARTVTCTEPNSLYREFVGSSPDARLMKLFDEFPVLAVICARLVNVWIDTTGEFLGRLHADRTGFNAFFKMADDLGSVAAIRAGLSDPHRGGRCVVKLRFENGTDLLYKPRSLAPERHFATMLNLLNQKDPPHSLRAACCWDRGEYGWMECIEHASCNAQTDVHSFYWSAGALLGVAYLAHGVDFHRENLIASGKFPVLIDLEGLWHPQKPGGISRGPEIDSVLRTGFLPRHDLQSGAIYEWSALGRQMHSKHSVAAWTCVNQDNMGLQTEQRDYPDQFHLPILEGITYLAPDHVGDVQAGFDWVGKNLLETEKGREQLAKWLRDLTKCPRRRLIRLTAHYQKALDRLTLPQSLRDQQTFGSVLTELGENGGAALDQELKALKQLDVPYFGQEDDDGDDLLLGEIFRLPFRERYAAQGSIIAESLADRC